MKTFLTLPYNLFIGIILFFFILSQPHADELDILLGATTKHYCSCLFVSELSKETCDEMFNRSIANAVPEPELVKSVKQIQINILSNEVLMEVEGKSIKSLYAEKKGCHLDN